MQARSSGMLAISSLLQHEIAIAGNWNPTPIEPQLSRTPIEPPIEPLMEQQPAAATTVDLVALACRCACPNPFS